VNEDQWLNGDDPRRMIAYLRAVGKASERKCRLLVCALARSLWEDLTDGRSRRAVEAAEAFADGSGSQDALQQATAQARLAHDDFREAFLAARRAAGGKYRRHVKEGAARADASAVAAWAASNEPLGFLMMTADCGGDGLGFYDEGAAVAALLQRYHTLVFELFGNPFSPACLGPAWLAWEDGAAVKLARAVYDGRRFDDMPVLADALEEAGCGDEEVVGHLRGPGLHTRGCHILDGILGLK
jgi:hypothetical protein